MIMRKPFHIPVSGSDSLEGHSRGMSVRDENPASSKQLLLGAAWHKDLGRDGLIDCCHPAPRSGHPSPHMWCLQHLLSAQRSGKGILTAVPQPAWLLLLPGFCKHLQKPLCEGDTGEGKDSRPREKGARLVVIRGLCHRTVRFWSILPGGRGNRRTQLLHAGVKRGFRCCRGLQCRLPASK